MTDATPPAGAPWGASAADWSALERLGLGADLLPVVSDPGAKISALSKMRDLGKTPSRFNAAGDVVGIPAWTQHQATDRERGRWAQDSRLGICIQTRQVKAIDIDIADPVRAAEVQALLELGLGVLPVRSRPNSGKRLLLLALPVDFPKRVIRTAHGIIELLSTGQQFVAVGTHPSGVRYAWAGGLPALVPEISMAELDVAWQALIEQFALPDGASTERRGMLPAVPRSADDLRDPAVAWLAENRWVTGYERDGRVDVLCPWADGHSTDSGPSSTSYFPAGVGGFAQGHFRCLHASCAGRTDGDFLEAVGYTASAFDVVETLPNDKGGEDQPLPPFERNRAGRPMPTLLNAVMAVRRPDVCGARIGYDSFTDALLIGADADGTTWRRFGDNDYTVLRHRLEARHHEPIGADMMRDAVRMVAEENRFDSAVQWARGLVWDGVERVDGFFVDYFKVADTPYARAVARYTWSALAGRCVEPGCKVDMAPVLIGLQAAGKTTAIEALCPLPSAFAEIDLERKDDDLARQIRGKLVCELAELRGLQTRDAEAIKAWVSRRTEEWTPKYKEFVTRYDRRCLLIGTGNKDGFLDDETGERRWLPMHVGQVDVARIEADREQLWAEGLHRFAQHGVEWRDAYTLAPVEHAKFKVSDPWFEDIAVWLSRDDMDGGKRADGAVRMADVMANCLGFSVQKKTRKDELRVAKVLRMLGYKQANRRFCGVQATCWVLAENSTFVVRAENSAFSEYA